MKSSSVISLGRALFPCVLSVPFTVAAGLGFYSIREIQEGVLEEEPGPCEGSSWL